MCSLEAYLCIIKVQTVITGIFQNLDQQQIFFRDKYFITKSVVMTKSRQAFSPALSFFFLISEDVVLLIFHSWGKPCPLPKYNPATEYRSQNLLSSTPVF